MSLGGVLKGIWEGQHFSNSLCFLATMRSALITDSHSGSKLCDHSQEVTEPGDDGPKTHLRYFVIIESKYKSQNPISCYNVISTERGGL